MLLLLALGTAVAARETPEIMSLTDDVSNDGMVVGGEDTILHVPSGRGSQSPGLAAAVALFPASNDSKRCSCLDSFQALPSRSGRSLLQFECLQRS